MIYYSHRVSCTVRSQKCYTIYRESRNSFYNSSSSRVVKQEGFTYSLCTQIGENMRITINRSFNRQTLIKVLGCPRDLSRDRLSLSGIAVFSTYQSRRYHCAYSRLLESRRTSVESAPSMALMPPHYTKLANTFYIARSAIER